MREPAERDVNKNNILKSCFYCLMANGLENTSIKNFCEATGMTASSIYYWFKDKDEIVIDATKFGLNLVADCIFDHVFDTIKNNGVEKLIKGLPTFVDEYKSELRLVYQVVTSPQYGEYMRDSAVVLDLRYDKCAKLIADALDVDFENLRPIVSIVTSTVLDYAVWNDDEKIRDELGFVIKLLKL